jgi:CxxC motif-containing protein (DUF1111 family)
MSGFDPRDYDAPHGVDMTAVEVEDLTEFTASLPVPRRIIPLGLQVAAAVGEELFTEIGCAVCHQPDLGSTKGIYSDLLLHHMGGYASVYYASNAQLANVEPTAPPAADEFRTPPLWGVADSAPYMHDGSARTLYDAVMAHGVQGAFAGEKFRQLKPESQKKLIVFLETLRAPNSR